MTSETQRVFIIGLILELPGVPTLGRRQSVHDLVFPRGDFKAIECLQQLVAGDDETVIFEQNGGTVLTE